MNVTKERTKTTRYTEFVLAVCKKIFHLTCLLFIKIHVQTADLCAQPKVVFEDELAVGSGPTREYFSILMNLITGGFNIHGQGIVTQVFEGEMDHKIPITNALLSQAGFYRAVGKMIGHICLHGGPFFYGLSPAIAHWLSFQNLESNPPPLVVRDVPDLELGSLLEQVQ